MHILRTVCGKVRLLYTYTVYNVTVLSILMSAISVCYEVKYTAIIKVANLETFESFLNGKHRLGL